MSARQVQKALVSNKHHSNLYDLRDGYSNLRKTALKFDILFPVLHGEEGEGGKLHKFLSKLHKPIVGTRNYQGMKKGWYKIPFKKYCDKNEIPTPKWKIVKSGKDIKNFGFPNVVKTSSGGSSREVFILKSETEFNKHHIKILTFKDLLVEEYINGIEVTVGILNNKALPILEIIPPKDGWFDYKNKYSGMTKEILNAPSLNHNLKIQVQETALKVHKYFNLGTFSRVDFIIKDENIYILELNTIPGLTENSLLPKETGTTFEKFIELLVNSAK
jgi:D-alanine-D-alanine ligase